MLVPAHFLFRLSYPCRHVKNVPRTGDERLLDLPEACRIDNLPELGGRKNFADVRLAWNERGLAFQVEVRGKEREPQAAADRPHSQDGAHLWIDTRDARTNHRASRFCSQFFFLPTGGGADQSDPVCGQQKIHRALEDAPLTPPGRIPFQGLLTKTGYVLEAFLPTAAVSGYDPETNPRLGFYYWIRDTELGDQSLGLGPDFRFWEDPSLWSTLELVDR